MAVRLASSTSDYIFSKPQSGSQLAFNSEFVTVCGWFRVGSPTGDIRDIPQGVFGFWEIGDRDGSTSGTGVSFSADRNGQLRFIYSVFSDVSGVNEIKTYAFPKALFGKWIHLCIVSGQIAHRFYLNGVLLELVAGLNRNETASLLWLNRTFIAQQGAGNQFQTNPGIIVGDLDVSRFSIYDAELNARDVDSLSRGLSPLQVRSDRLRVWWDFTTTQTTYKDRVGGFRLEDSGSPTFTDGPQNLLFTSGQKVFPMESLTIHDPSLGNAGMQHPIDIPAIPSGFVAVPY